MYCGVIRILRYKDTCIVVKQRGINGKISCNKDDTYIKCRKNVQIYRYNNNTLAIQFNSNRYATTKIKELSNMGVFLAPIQIGDSEQVYIFPEEFLSVVAEVVKARRKIKRELTEEQKEVLRQRIKNARKKVG